MSCGLAGHAVVRAKAGDRGRCMTGYEFSCGDALAQFRGTRMYALGSARSQSRRVVAVACSLRTDTML